MKQLLIILSLVLGCLQPGYTQKPVLKFNKDGKFKIVQFTDVHYIHGNPKSAVSLERINEVLDAEKPDLVLFTGDVIYGQPAEEGMRTILNLAANRQIPFGVTFGNHDDEQGLTRTQLFDIIQTIPYNLTDSVAGVTGVTNFILPLKSSDGKKDAAILYCMDSHSYSQIKGIGGYDYIKFDQIRCAPQLNSGMFASMKEMGDILGVFVGHDHDDDYAVFWKGILLAYGRYTGGDTVYNNLSNGARVIEMTEGSTNFRTWIRLKDGEVINTVNYPSDFIKKKD